MNRRIRKKRAKAKARREECIRAIVGIWAAWLNKEVVWRAARVFPKRRRRAPVAPA